MDEILKGCLDISETYNCVLLNVERDSAFLVGVNVRCSGNDFVYDKITNNLLPAILRHFDTSRTHAELQSQNCRDSQEKSLVLIVFICWLYLGTMKPPKKARHGIIY